MARIGEFGGRRRRGFRRGRRRGGAVAVFIAAFLLAAFFFAGPLTGEWTSPPLSPDPPAKLADTHTDFSGRVTRIVDGDTFYVEGAPVRIRLWGLDAPERREDGYDEATAALRRISAGRLVSCKTVDRDRYGRIVARCYLSSGDDITALMIESGTADEYQYFSKGYYARRGVRRGAGAP